METELVCHPVSLPEDLALHAGVVAAGINPANMPNMQGLHQVMGMMTLIPDHIALLTQKYWGRSGVKLSVAFMEDTPPELGARILKHMNVWSQYCNCSFHLAPPGSHGQVRISRRKGGYWSYLGTDIMSVPANAPTMNLEGFSMLTSEDVFAQVVPHEAGHTLGFPHEHMRREIVAKIHQAKAVEYFGRTQGWSPQMVRQQVLTPLEESSLLTGGASPADQDSIMCYQIPGSITVDGQPIRGGKELSAFDKEYSGRAYPIPYKPAPDLVATVKVYADGRVEKV